MPEVAEVSVPESFVEALTKDGRTDVPPPGDASGATIESACIPALAAGSGDDGSRAVSSIAAASTQKTRRKAPTPITPAEPDVFTRGAAGVLSGFFGLGADFARVDFFVGITSSFAKSSGSAVFEQGRCRLLVTTAGAKRVSRRELDTATAGCRAVCHPGHTYFVIRTSMLRVAPAAIPPARLGSARVAYGVGARQTVEEHVLSGVRLPPLTAR